MVAYLFERFPKFSQTFCYREVAELSRQGPPPVIFSLRSPQLGPEESWDRAILDSVQVLPEGESLAKEVASGTDTLDREQKKVVRSWRGRSDSLRLQQALCLGPRLRSARVTHLHAHFAGMAARTAFWVSQFFDVPWSMTVHANDIFSPRPYDLGLDQLMTSAKTVVAVSDFAAEFLRQKFPSANVVRIYNGIDLSEFSAPPPVEPPLLLSIGRLISKKGFDLFIEACRILRERGCEYRAEIIGDGPLRDQLSAQIVQSQLQSTLTLAGEKSHVEIRRRLAQATALVLGARVEEDGDSDNLPTVIMEAMAASLPVVATTVAGIPEMVVAGETGLLVPPENPTALADAISQVLLDRKRAHEMGTRGRARAGELFAIDRNVAALRQIFR